MTASDDLSALLARVALQDRSAFERVYRATCAHLLGVALRILNNRERAEEVLQEAFVNVWHGARGYNASVAMPMTWLINIVRNKAIDTLTAKHSPEIVAAYLHTFQALDDSGGWTTLEELLTEEERLKL